MERNMRRYWVLLLVGLAALVIIPMAANAFTFCGEEQYGVQLRFHNPDLNPWSDPVPEDSSYNQPSGDNITESSWQFFIQFQAVVDEEHSNAPAMDDIKSFWFAFGPIKEAAIFNPTGEDGGGLDNCEKPWLPGVQLYSYRGDANPDDGFFVPINTTGVTDGTYGAAVYACTAVTFDECQPGGADGAGNPNLVSAAWSRATVYNDHPSFGSDFDRSVDFIKPWPMILPGDGVQTNNDACNDPQKCVTIEFAEFLDRTPNSEAPNSSAIRLWFNGIEVTHQLQDWVPPKRDNDLILGNDGEETGHPLSDCGPLAPLQDNMPSDARLCQKVVWGDAFAWQAPREFQSQDEFRVWARDGAGNVVEKTISFSDETRGGVIPHIEADVDVSVSPQNLSVRPGDSKVFTIHIANKGNDTAHVFPTINAPEQIEAIIGDDHIDVEPGGSTTVPLQAGPTSNASEGEYAIELVFEYIAGNRRQQEKIFPVVVADETAELSSSAKESQGDGSDGGDGGDGASGPVTTPLGDGFQRKCGTQADYEVCFLYPGQMQRGESFTFEVQVAEAAEQRTQRHEVDAGKATLEMQYLSADRSEQLANGDSFSMEQVSTGQYRADVTLKNLAPVLHAVFDSEIVQMSMVVHESQEAQQTGASLPGFETGLALVAAAGVAVALTRRD